MRVLKDAKPGDVVSLMGVVVAHHDGQAAIEFDSGDAPSGGEHAAMLPPTSWSVTNNIGYTEPNFKERARQLAGLAAAKQVEIIADLQREIRDLQDQLAATGQPVPIRVRG